MVLKRLDVLANIKHLKGKRIRRPRSRTAGGSRPIATSRHHAQEFLHQAALVAAHVKSSPARLENSGAVGHGVPWRIRIGPDLPGAFKLPAIWDLRVASQASMHGRRDGLMACDLMTLMNREFETWWVERNQT